MNCRICSAESREIFSAKVLSKHIIKYYHCPNCDFLQTEEPYWLNEAYESAIGIIDTGILKRNLLFAKRSAALISAFYSPDKIFLDYAGGYGIFVRLMRDLGFDFYWYDPFAENLFAKGFEYKNNNVYVITAFECFEHFVDPMIEIQKILNISDNLIFSTRLFNGLPPDPSEWWYYSLESGQHISFYSLKTLKFIGEKFGVYLYSDNKAFHIYSKIKRSNFLFNAILKLSDTGLGRLLYARKKSKADSDNELLNKYKQSGI